MKLAELQRAFAARVLQGDDAILAEIHDNSRTDRQTLMHVYEHAYGARLAEILEADYDKLLAALGPEDFLEMAHGYVETHPSKHPNARYFGRHMPAFLAEAPAAQDRPWLAELAAVEWAMSEVFQAEDPPRLAMEAMAALHPTDWPRLTLIPVSDCRRLETRHGGPEAWLALDASEDPAAAATEAAGAEESWIVWRQDDRANFRMLEPPEAWAFDQATKGAPFAHLCEGLLEWFPETEAATRMAGYLQIWIGAGLIAAYDLADLE